jgi:hypothetical protein
MKLSILSLPGKRISRILPRSEYYTKVGGMMIRSDEALVKELYTQGRYAEMIIELDPLIRALVFKHNISQDLYENSDKAQNIRLLLLQALPKYPNLTDDHIYPFVIKICKNEICHRPNMMFYAYAPLEWGMNVSYGIEDQLQAKLELERLISKLDPSKLKKDELALMLRLKADIESGQFYYKNSKKLITDYRVSEQTWTGLQRKIREANQIEAKGMDTDHKIDPQSPEDALWVLGQYYEHGVKAIHLAKKLNCPVSYISHIIRGQRHAEVVKAYHAAHPGLKTAKHNSYGHNIKLLKPDVHFILSHPEMTSLQLADKFGVKYPTITNIRKGKIHKETYAEFYGLPAPFRKIPKPLLKETRKYKRLSPKEVVEVLEAADRGVSREQLSEQYGVSVTNIRTIIVGETWKEIHRIYHERKQNGTVTTS